jgi:hypothetical protein
MVSGTAPDPTAVNAGHSLREAAADVRAASAFHEGDVRNIRVPRR